MNLKSYKDLLQKNRSCRIFDEAKRVDDILLRDLIDLTRFCASGRNAQPLKYKIVTDSIVCAEVFATLKWAGYLMDWDGPEVGDRPSAYLIQCLDTTYGKDCLCDDGLQLEVITTGATLSGLSNCIIKSFNKDKLTQILSLPHNLSARYVVALGYGKERVVLEDMTNDVDADFKYWRDENGVHHVPKRPLESLIIE